jgi:cyclopentanol dehydrogenase
MDRLKNKVAIVTGAAGGMGAAEARLFAEEGARVLATDMQYEKMKQWVDQAKGEGLQVACIEHDVTSEAHWKKVADHAIGLYGQIDILVNNAGVYPPGATTDNTDRAAWDKIIAINLTGPFLGVKAVVPYMRKAGRGSIINVSSIAAMVGGNGPAYTASKAGLRVLTKDMAIEYAKYLIRVNSLHPGGVRTPMTDFMKNIPNAEELVKSSCPQGRLADAIELAYGALFLASDESMFMTGSELVMDGGLTAR